MPVKLPPIPKTGTTRTRKRFWDDVRSAVIAAQKVAGRHVTVDEHLGKGSVINVDETTARRSPSPGVLGACCHDTVCSQETASSCTGDGGIFLGEGISCSPNPCDACVSGAYPSTVSYSYDFLNNGFVFDCGTTHAIDSGSFSNSGTNLVPNYNGDDPTVIGPCYFIVTPCAGPINCGGTDYWFDLQIIPWFDEGSDCWRCDFTFRFYTESSCTTTAAATFFLDEEQSCLSGHDIRGVGNFVDVFDYGDYSFNISASFS